MELRHIVPFLVTIPHPFHRALQVISVTVRTGEVTWVSAHHGKPQCLYHFGLTDAESRYSHLMSGTLFVVGVTTLLIGSAHGEFATLDSHHCERHPIHCERFSLDAPSSLSLTVGDTLPYP